VLRDIEGLTIDQTAEVLDVSHTAVTARLWRARLQLREGLTLPEGRRTRVRYFIITILFAVSCFSFGDRVALSLAGSAMGKAINLTPLRLGYLFSAFSWAYVLGQLPAGGLTRPLRI
jgi:hypothetical protein